MVSESEIHPPIHTTVLREAKNNFSEQETDRLEKVINSVDRQITQNYKVFKSEHYPGLTFSYSKVSARKAAEEALGHSNKVITGKRKILVEFSPFAPPPGGEAGNLTPSVYDNTIKSFPSVVKEKPAIPLDDVETIVLGLPYGPTGQVTKEWVEGIKKNGFGVYGVVYAELLRELLPKGMGVKLDIIFKGGSQGAILADQTAQNLPEYKIRLLLDNPTAAHHPRWGLGYLAGLRMGLGFVAELGFRTLTRFDKLHQDVLTLAPKYGERLHQFLSDEELVADQDKAQDKLKTRAFLAEIVQLIKGTPLEARNRTYITAALADPANPNLRRYFDFLRGLFVKTPAEQKREQKRRDKGLKTKRDLSYSLYDKNGNNRLIRTTRAFHFVYRTDRVGRWMKILDKVASATS